MRTRVKICGITCIEDALAAVAAGADAIGLVFYAPSPRYVSIENAMSIAAAVPPFITVTGLFVNADQEMIAETVERVGIDLLQFHGDEAPAFCERHGKPWIKAIRMQEGVDLHAATLQYQNAKALLLDTYQAGVPGGTGTAFDWARIPAELAKPVILAGGLDPENVAAAVQSVRPYAVDVSGGVEREKGLKDHQKIAAFMNGVGIAERI